MQFLAALFGKALDVLVPRVRRHVAYLCSYRSNVEKLKEHVQRVKVEKQSMNDRVQEAERKGENIQERVTSWLTKVDEKITEIDVFLEDEGHLKTGCSTGFPNLKLRHQLGRKAKKMIPQCVELLQHKNFTTISHRSEPEAIDVALSDDGYESFSSRKAITEEVMNSLRDPKSKMIGIYEQGGVGKTTLVKAIARKAKAKKLFNLVIMVNITITPDVRKIQGEMADMLGLRLDDESEIGRAGRLQQRSKKEKENALLIFDDLWAGLDLNMLGIQFKDDDDSNSLKERKSSSDSKSCKILLTSRSKDVLLSEMNAKDSIFPLEVIKQKESKKLFDKVAGITNQDLELKSLATKIVKKCADLP
ncbi:disease resistance protein At4g27190-like [Prosopis cineraria]|uniref:disease resistance protein At4g27190-like n=1 Tax=Prosopis cineraria TaxID=364024 RepID=UPI00240F60C1|nr:disease resistance protein At4g27190-like [Prosopis cineraria]XP_054782296.1 disease resistance protein At4g27190-like [Prosopis cineraria]